jgi:membrane fusion protein, copper/silver efflux system
MKITKITSNPYINFGVILLIGILIGRLVLAPSQHKGESHTNSEVVSKSEVWTCSMHPNIRMEQPGKCPICGMDLIPLTQNSGTFSDPDAIRLTPEAAKLAEVQTTIVTKKNRVNVVRLYGKVLTDERLLQTQSAHISGRIEKLAVNSTGETVEKGQVLATIYSPELITSQQELIETSKTKQSQPELFEAAKEKLRLWKFSEKQISLVENSGTPLTNFEIISNTSGIVLSRRVNNGDYISAGTILYEIADLSKVWVVFDAYESDLQFLKKGDKVTFNIQAMPGNEYSGRIVFIDPVIDPVLRVAKVRVETENASGRLKPEMFATGLVESSPDQYSKDITIPRSSVLWTGKRSIVYVKLPGTTEPVFKVREIGIGPPAGENYIVTDGLSEGEEIVTNGTFSVDASAQLEGKPSMMNIAHSENSNFEHTVFHVSGNCEMCKDRIEKAALSVAGVKEAVWNIETDELALAYDNTKTSLLEIHRAIAAMGHDTSLLKADDEVYKALPECCLYRK